LAASTRINNLIIYPLTDQILTNWAESYGAMNCYMAKVALNILPGRHVARFFCYEESPDPESTSPQPAGKFSMKVEIHNLPHLEG
jgi:hypothetical protein